MTTKERVERKRRERSLTYKIETCACELDAVMDKHFGRTWHKVKGTLIAFIIVTLCSINIG